MIGSYCLFGQQQIQGMVVNENDEPVGFSHVYNKTLELGKVSDMNGKFSVLGNRGDTIEFSYVGYKTHLIAVNASHLTSYLKVTLPRDSVLLPSITIYADKNFRVPLRQDGPPLIIPGVSIIDPPPPIKAGDFYVGSNAGNGLLAPSIGIYGPITYFSRDEREKRKAIEAREETRETISYQKFMAHDSVRIHLRERFQLDSAQYNTVIYRLHTNFPGIQRAYMHNEIWNWLLSYFERTAPIVRRNSMIDR